VKERGKSQSLLHQVNPSNDFINWERKFRQILSQSLLHQVNPSNMKKQAEREKTFVSQSLLHQVNPSNY